MRIWLAPSAFYPSMGGVEELTLKLAQHLMGRGHDVVVITNLWPRNLPEKQTVEGIAVVRIPFEIPTRDPRTWYASRRHALRALTQLEALCVPDVLHIQCPSSQTRHVAAHARRHGVPLLITTQGETYMDAGELYLRSPFARRDLRRATASSTSLTACSAHAAAGAARIAPAFADAVVVPNGIDCADWIGLPIIEEPVLAAWGRHVPQKGFDLLMQAFSLLRLQEPSARLLVGGAGPETERLKSLSPEGVTFVGALDRAGVRTLLSRASVVAVPSRVEPFGIVALETLAAGRGLVYSTSGGLGEAAGTCGRGADPTDTQAFADALLSELRNPTAAAQGQSRAAAFSWQHITTRYEELYDRAGRPAESN